MSHRGLWLVPAAAAVVVVVLVIALALGRGGSGGGSGAGRPFAASASISNRAVAFGDPLVARVDVVLDPRAIDPTSVTVQPSFGAYRVVGRSLRRTNGDGERLTFAYVLQCLDPICVPPTTRV